MSWVGYRGVGEVRVPVGKTAHRISVPSAEVELKCSCNDFNTFQDDDNNNNIIINNNNNDKGFIPIGNRI